MRRVLTISAGAAMAVNAVSAGAAVAAAASTTKVVYSFAGGGDGEYPSTDLIVDGAGNVYGTSVQGGDFGTGTVFELTPSGASWTTPSCTASRVEPMADNRTAASRSTLRAISTARGS